MKSKREKPDLVEQLLRAPQPLSKLLKVYSKSEFDHTSELLLVFESRAYAVSFNDEDCTLSLRKARRPAKRPAGFRDEKKDPHWGPLIGKELCIRWAMTNSQGYTDGLILSAAEADVPCLILLATTRIVSFAVSTASADLQIPKEKAEPLARSSRG